MPSLVQASYDKQDLAKFKEGLITWREWLTNEEYERWRDFVATAEANALPDVTSTYWSLTNIHGSHKGNKEAGSTDQELRISDRDATIPRVSLCMYAPYPKWTRTFN